MDQNVHNSTSTNNQQNPTANDSEFADLIVELRQHQFLIVNQFNTLAASFNGMFNCVLTSMHSMKNNQNASTQNNNTETEYVPAVSLGECSLVTTCFSDGVSIEPVFEDGGETVQGETVDETVDQTVNETMNFTKDAPTSNQTIEQASFQSNTSLSSSSSSLSQTKKTLIRLEPRDETTLLQKLPSSQSTPTPRSHLTPQNPSQFDSCPLTKSMLSTIHANTSPLITYGSSILSNLTSATASLSSTVASCSNNTASSASLGTQIKLSISKDSNGRYVIPIRKQILSNTQTLTNSQTLPNTQTLPNSQTLPKPPTSVLQSALTSESSSSFYFDSLPSTSGKQTKLTTSIEYTESDDSEIGKIAAEISTREQHELIEVDDDLPEFESELPEFSYDSDDSDIMIIDEIPNDSGRALKRPLQEDEPFKEPSFFPPKSHQEINQKSHHEFLPEVPEMPNSSPIPAPTECANPSPKYYCCMKCRLILWEADLEAHTHRPKVMHSCNFVESCPFESFQKQVVVWHIKTAHQKAEQLTNGQNRKQKHKKAIDFDAFIISIKQEADITEPSTDIVPAYKNGTDLPGVEHVIVRKDILEFARVKRVVDEEAASGFGFEFVTTAEEEEEETSNESYERAEIVTNGHADLEIPESVISLSQDIVSTIQHATTSTIYHSAAALQNGTLHNSTFKVPNFEYTTPNSVPIKYKAALPVIQNGEPEIQNCAPSLQNKSALTTQYATPTMYNAPTTLQNGAPSVRNYSRTNINRDAIFGSSIGSSIDSSIGSSIDSSIGASILSSTGYTNATTSSSRLSSEFAFSEEQTSYAKPSGAIWETEPTYQMTLPASLAPINAPIKQLIIPSGASLPVGAKIIIVRNTPSTLTSTSTSTSEPNPPIGSYFAPMGTSTSLTQSTVSNSLDPLDSSYPPPVYSSLNSTQLNGQSSLSPFFDIEQARKTYAIKSGTQPLAPISTSALPSDFAIPTINTDNPSNPTNKRPKIDSPIFSSTNGILSSALSSSSSSSSSTSSSPSIRTNGTLSPLLMAAPKKATTKFNPKYYDKTYSCAHTTLEKGKCGYMKSHIANIVDHILAAHGIADPDEAMSLVEETHRAKVSAF